MTTEYCVAECRCLGFANAGTQYRSQCFCGNDYNSYGKAPEAECDLPCTGAPAQICGGIWRNSVYRTGLQVPVK